MTSFMQMVCLEQLQEVLMVFSRLRTRVQKAVSIRLPTMVTASSVMCTIEHVAP